MLVAGFASLGLHLVGSRLLQGGMKRVRETANLAAVCMICFAFFFFLSIFRRGDLLDSSRKVPGFHI